MSVDPTIAANPANESEPEPIRVRRALISVSDKSGVLDFAQGLQALGVEIVSTGGTAAALSEGGIAVRTVEELTGAPEILGGRVKTLHPRLHAALLAVREDPEHAATLEREGIETIDLVCTNLYPFERAVARREATDAEVIENIDIGGPTMIRAAAKNHRYVAVVVRPESYDAVLAELEEGDGEISAGTRHWLANEAFAATARYDAAISRWFGERYEDFPTHQTVSLEKFMDLSYGENPHQRAALYTEVGTRAHVLSRVSKRHGKDSLVQQRARSRLGLQPARGPRRPRVRDRQAQQPVRGGRGRERARRLREGALLRPGVGVRRRDRPEPADRRGAGEAAARELRRGPDRARLRGRGDGDPAAEAGDPNPRGHRAADDAPGGRTSSGCGAGCSSRSSTTPPATARA